MKLVGGGEYNLNVLKEIDVTDSYLDLSEEVKGCQNGESFVNCTTKKFIDSLLGQCRCLPFDIRQTEKVKSKFNQIQLIQANIGSSVHPRTSPLCKECKR